MSQQRAYDNTDLLISANCFIASKPISPSLQLINASNASKIKTEPPCTLSYFSNFIDKKNFASSFYKPTNEISFLSMKQIRYHIQHNADDNASKVILKRFTTGTYGSCYKQEYLDKYVC
jgi:hypothetical protein